MSFPQFPNGDQICTIPLDYKGNENGERNLVYDLLVGWQLHQISDDKGKHGVHAFYRRCLGALPALIVARCSDLNHQPNASMTR